MKETRSGNYKYSRESFFAIDRKNNDAYEFVSHVYTMDDGRSFVEYEKVRNKRTEFLKEMEMRKND